MNIELRFSTSYATNDSINDKYLCHGQLDTHYGTLYMICNGLGDPHSNDIASNMTFEIIRRIVTSIPGRSAEELLNNAIKEANRAVYESISNNPHKHRIGSELVILLIDPDETHNALVCHLGRSRVYRVWDGNITRINKGHARVRDKSEQEIMDREDASSFVEYKMPARFIGINEEIEPEIRKIFVQEGDRYIICTRGITDHVNDTEIIQLFEENAQNYADNILRSARNRGSENNSVVQIIDIDNSSGSVREKNREPIASNLQNRT